MPTADKSSASIAAIVLFGLGCMDLFRGLAHTFMIHWANDTFAHLDLSMNGNDQLMLLGAFGISNWLTGMLFILIATKARALASASLVIILVAYAIGWLGMQYAGVSPDSDFYGRFIMLGYFAVCLAGIVWQYMADKQSDKRS
ncbi:MAG: hypothetical protein LRY53_00710 [Burkholderiaceae bacterium]|nr:hypothetical protein [Burkholderiaceae bacterium]MCD8564199.1 hypothetical protein [Burkholderiaceae bacterium]